VAGRGRENNFRAARHYGMVRIFSGVLSGRDGLWARFPATMWLANFRLSLRDEFKRRLEPFVLLCQRDASILDNR